MVYGSCCRRQGRLAHASLLPAARRRHPLAAPAAIAQVPSRLVPGSAAIRRPQSRASEDMVVVLNFCCSPRSEELQQGVAVAARRCRLLPSPANFQGKRAELVEGTTNAIFIIRPPD